MKISLIYREKQWSNLWLAVANKLPKIRFIILSLTASWFTLYSFHLEFVRFYQLYRCTVKVFSVPTNPCAHSHQCMRIICPVVTIYDKCSCAESIWSQLGWIEYDNRTGKIAKMLLFVQLHILHVNHTT